jgi:hypothetical protein
MPHRLVRKAARRYRRWAADSPVLTVRQFSVAFTVLFALVTVALAGEGLLVGANSHRIHENRATSLLARKNSREAQLAICRSQNRGFRAIRGVILSGPKQELPILRGLGYTPAQVAAIEKAALAIARQEIRKFPLLGADAQHPKGNCKVLPTTLVPIPPIH